MNIRDCKGSGWCKWLKIHKNGGYMSINMSIKILTLLTLLGLTSCGKIVVEPKPSEHVVEHKVSGDVKANVVLDLGSLKTLYAAECQTPENLELFDTPEACEAFKVSEFIKIVQDNLDKGVLWF